MTGSTAAAQPGRSMATKQLPSPMAPPWGKTMRSSTSHSTPVESPRPRSVGPHRLPGESRARASRTPDRSGTSTASTSRARRKNTTNVRPEPSRPENAQAEPVCSSAQPRPHANETAARRRRDSPGQGRPRSDCVKPFTRWPSLSREGSPACLSGTWDALEDRSVQDTCKNRSQGRWLVGSNASGDLTDDAAAGVALDFAMDLSDAEVCRSCKRPFEVLPEIL